MTQDKPKLTPAEQRRRRDDRTTAIRLRFSIRRHLDDHDIVTLAAIGDALGMPGEEATKLLSRHQWREGDIERLQAAATRLGLNV